MRFNNDKGVAGLTILLSVITMLFVIGLLIMIYALMGGELSDATFDAVTTSYINETTPSVLNETGITLVGGSLRNVVCTIDAVSNTTTQEVWGTGNYTVTNCFIVYSADDTEYNNTAINVTYSALWDRDSEASDVINDTISAVSETTDWFPIFIVITAMVVLVLLTVIIIVSIRGSGLMTGTGGKGGNVGSA